MNTMDLFSPHTHARSDDPSTSVRAARRAMRRAPSIAGRIMDELRKGPGNMSEIARRLGEPEHRVWRRISDLLRADQIRVVGERKGSSGDAQRVYAVQGEWL